MATTPNAAGLYVCGICKAEYARADYLIRHVRSHTRQRPFVCSVCAKGFGRQDLLKRHMTIHTSHTGTQSGSAVAGLQNGRPSHRVHQACRPCAEKKLKCADEKPCRRCKEKNIVCDFDDGGHRLVQEVSMDLSSPQPSVPFTDTMIEPQEGWNDLDFDDHPASLEDTQRLDLPEMPPTVAQSTHDLSTAPQEPIAREILGNTLNFPPMGTYLQYDNDIFLGDLDFSFLNDLGPSRMASPPPIALLSELSTQQSTMLVGAEAYKHSSALTAWNPSHEENHNQEQQDLILAQSNAKSLPCNNDASRGRVFPKKELSQTARDQVLATIVRLTSGSASNRIVASFPSLEILGDLIHHALHHMRERQIGNFIHFPAFDMNKQRPELLGAIIAYGSVTSPSPATRKFGYALQETMRVALNHLVSHRSPDQCSAIIHLFSGPRRLCCLERARRLTSFLHTVVLGLL